MSPSKGELSHLFVRGLSILHCAETVVLFIFLDLRTMKPSLGHCVAKSTWTAKQHTLFLYGPGLCESACVCVCVFFDFI